MTPMETREELICATKQSSEKITYAGDKTQSLASYHMTQHEISIRELFEMKVNVQPLNTHGDSHSI